MKAGETTLQPMIEGMKQYVVPLFQRPYSWEKKEWSVLWEDLRDLCNSERPRPHFIGSIVTIQTVSVPQGVPKYLLIDGQQRLTTLFVLLTLIRDLAREQGDRELADEVHNTLLTNPYRKGIDAFKVLPTQDDRSAFMKLVNGSPPDVTVAEKSGRRIREAYDFFRKEMLRAGIGPAGLKKVITEDLITVGIVLDKDDNPYLVFESLNAKGRPLTQADLIRNYFFLRIHQDHQDEVHARYWRPMQDALGENLTEFIRHFLMRDGALVNQSDVYVTLKDRLPADGAVDYLAVLERFSRFYKRLLDPESEPSLEIRRRLIRLSRLDITTAYPFLLNAYDALDRGIVNSAEFVEILELLENFLVRRFVCGVPTNQLRKIFPPLFKQAVLTGVGTVISGLRTTLASKGYPVDARFRDDLIRATLYGGGDRTRKVRLILERLNEAHGHKESVVTDELTVEHVMPQTLTPEWQAVLGEEWQETHELWLHTLGNLTLTAYNAELSNDSYVNKQRRLESSHIELNIDFREVSAWDAAAIETRGARLAELAMKVWSYFGETASIPTTDQARFQVPRRVNFLGKSIEVRTWRDVLEQTLNLLHDSEPERFAEAVVAYPAYFGPDKSRFRSARQLKNEIYVSTHFSAQSICTLCRQIIRFCEEDPEDWVIETGPSEYPAA